VKKRHYRHRAPTPLTGRSNTRLSPFALTPSTQRETIRNRRLGSNRLPARELAAADGQFGEIPSLVRRQGRLAASSVL